MVLRITFVVYFERLERFKNIKNKSLQSCLSIFDFIDGIRSGGTGGSRGAHYPPHPLNLGSYRKEKQKTGIDTLLLFISKDWKDSKISKTKVFSLVYQYLISQMELGPAELGGRGGHIIPLIPSIQAVIEKRNRKQEQTQPITIELHLQIFLTFQPVLCFLDLQFYFVGQRPGKGITKNVKNWSFLLEKSQNLHAVFLLQFKILLPQGVDTVNHGLNKLNFRVSKTMLVGNVIGVS